MIRCSVGILTYNSEKTLHRTLESVKDFSDVIISDGGSTDTTLNIAHEYNCKIIEQEAKLYPSGDAEHPIKDFALERNGLLAAATEDWFFWLDSDEYISKELHDEVEVVCNQNNPKFHAYEIRIVHQSPDATTTYKTLKQVHQIRFFNKITGGKFERKIHEKFKYDKSVYNTGRLKGAWFVPTSKTNFSEYKKAVNYRLQVMHSDAIPKNFLVYIKKAIYQPIKRTAGIFLWTVVLRLRFGYRNTLPLGYQRNRLYSQWVTFRIVTQLYFKK